MTILDKLTQQNDFTETEKRIAEFILSHQSDIAAITIQDLAKKAYSSHSAVIRLTKKLGFSGYRDFRVMLIQDIQNNLHTTASVDPNFPFQAYDDSFDIAKKMADLSIDAIRKTVNKLDKHNLYAIAKVLLNAERIFLYGLGDSQIRAKSFQNKFNKINRYPILAEEHSEGSWNALNMTKKDCAIFISYGGSSTVLEQSLMYIRKKQIDTILLTGNTESTMASVSNFLIEVPQGELEHVKVGTFVSQISFEYVLDTLFSIMYANEYTKHLVEIKEKQSVMEKYFRNV